MHVAAAGASKGGAGWKRAVGSLGAERTVGGGLEWGWDCLCVHVEAAGARGGRLRACCGLSPGREDCARKVGMGLGLPVCARSGCRCK